MAPTLFEVLDLISEAERSCLRSARSFAELVSSAASIVEPLENRELAALVNEACIAASAIAVTAEKPVDLLRTMRSTLADYDEMEKDLWEPTLHKEADRLFSALVFLYTEYATSERYNAAGATLAKSTRWGSVLQATVPDPVVLAAGIRARQRDLVWSVASTVSCFDLLSSDPRALQILARDTGCPANLLRVVGTGSVSVEDAVLAASLIA